MPTISSPSTLSWPPFDSQTAYIRGIHKGDGQSFECDCKGDKAPK